MARTLLSKATTLSSSSSAEGQLSQMLLVQSVPPVASIWHMSENVDADNNAETSTIDSCTDAAFQDAVSSCVEEDTNESPPSRQQKATQPPPKDHMCCTSGAVSETSSARKHQHIISHQHMSQLQAWLDAREGELEKREAAVRAAQSDQRKQTQSLRLELERKEAELAAMQHKINTLVKSKVDLQEELEMTKVQGRFKRAEMQQEIGRLQRELGEAVGERGSGGGGYAREIGELKEYVQQLKSQNQSLMVELDAFSEQEKERYSMQPPTSQQSSFHQQEATSEYHTIRELEDELASERETSVELREQLMAVRQELNGKVDNLEMQLQLERMKSAEAEAQLGTPPTPVPVSTIQSKQNPIQHMAVKYAEELQEAEMRAVDAERRLEQLSQALGHKEDEMSEVQKNQVTLRKNLLSMNNQVVGLTSQVGELQNRLRAKAGQLEIAQFQVDRYRQQVDRARQIAQSHQLSAFLFLAYLGPRIVNIGQNLHMINQKIRSNQIVRP